MDKLLIIKIGGNIIDDESKLTSFLKEFAALPGLKILVHGGGKLATQLAQKLGLTQQMVEGRRITDGETLKVVTMVYAGYINKQVVAQLQGMGCDALGITGADGNAITAHKRTAGNGEVDYGFAGDIDTVNSSFLSHLLQQKFTLVVAPITHNKKGQLLNTNADTVAQELAKGLSASFDVQLIYSFEKSGVLLDVSDETSLLPQITKKQYAELKKQGKVFAGMIPKLDNAFAALDSGVKEIVIGNAASLTDLLHGKTGTRLVVN